MKMPVVVHSSLEGLFDSSIMQLHWRRKRGGGAGGGGMCPPLLRVGEGQRYVCAPPLSDPEFRPRHRAC